jgi:hypothetical protein
MSTYAIYYERNARTIVDFMMGPYVESFNSESWEIKYPQEYDLFATHTNYPLIFLKKYLRLTDMFQEVDGTPLFNYIMKAFFMAAKNLLATPEASQQFADIVDLLFTKVISETFHQLVKDWTTELPTPYVYNMDSLENCYRLRGFIIKQLESRMDIHKELEYVRSHPPKDWASVSQQLVTKSNVMSSLHYFMIAFSTQ